MKVQELHDTIFICTNPRSAAPSRHMTEHQWQEQFRLMRQAVRPAIRKRMYGSRSSETVHRSQEWGGSYDGITNWQSYALYINDTLTQLRQGETAYAWFTYQIRDLLRFEHDRLYTRYCPQDRMWVLWLESRGL